MPCRKLAHIVKNTDVVLNCGNAGTDLWETLLNSNTRFLPHFQKTLQPFQTHASVSGTEHTTERKTLQTSSLPREGFH